eukprot:89989-Chlamydomonas_euryale.AAC.2
MQVADNKLKARPRVKRCYQCRGNTCRRIEPYTTCRRIEHKTHNALLLLQLILLVDALSPNGCSARRWHEDRCIGRWWAREQLAKRERKMMKYV